MLLPLPLRAAACWSSEAFSSFLAGPEIPSAVVVVRHCGGRRTFFDHGFFHRTMTSMGRQDMEEVCTTLHRASGGTIGRCRAVDGGKIGDAGILQRPGSPVGGAMSETQGSTLQSATATISEHFHWHVEAGWNCMMGRGSDEEKKTRGFFAREKVTSSDVCFWEHLLFRGGFVVRTMACRPVPCLSDDETVSNPSLATRNSHRISG